MTKLREPNSFADAVTRVAGLITWGGAADATGKSERAVRAWSDPDADRCPCIDDCLALDAAYILAGGGDPPLLAVYMRKLEMRGRPGASLVEAIQAGAAAMRANGEFAADFMAAAQPGASEALKQQVVRDVTDAADLMLAAVTKLTSGDTG